MDRQLFQSALNPTNAFSLNVYDQVIKGSEVVGLTIPGRFNPVVVQPGETIRIDVANRVGQKFPTITITKLNEIGYEGDG